MEGTAQGAHPDLKSGGDVGAFGVRSLCLPRKENADGDAARLEAGEHSMGVRFDSSSFLGKEEDEERQLGR